MRALKVLVPTAAAFAAVTSGAYFAAGYHAIAAAITSPTNSSISPVRTTNLYRSTAKPIDNQILAAVRSLSEQVKDQASKIEQLHSQVDVLQKQLNNHVDALRKELQDDTKQINGRLLATCFASVEADVSATNAPSIIAGYHGPLAEGVPSDGGTRQSYAACASSDAWKSYFFYGRMFMPFK